MTSTAASDAAETTQKITLAKGLNMGLRKAMEDDPKVLVMGEDVGKLGGVFRITDGLQKDFGEDRVIDSPLAESGIVGTAVGLAMRGYRPVVRDPVRRVRLPGLRPDRLPGREDALPQPGQARRCRSSSASRSAAASARSSTTASRPEAQFAHTPGLKVVACSNPIDGYWMIQQAIASDDPVIFLEPKRQYHADKAELDDTATPTPLFTSRVVRPGTDVTVLAYGPMVKIALKAAEAAPSEGKSLEVIDLRTLSPLDMGPVLESVRRTGRAVVAHEAHVNLGMGAELAARITEQCFYSLEAPVLRVGGFDTPYPAVADRGGLAARPRPGARRRRPLAGLLRVPVTDAAVRVPASRRRRGPDRGRDRLLEGQGRRRRRDQRHRRRDRDREVAGRAALAVRRHRPRPARARGRDGPGRHADHPHRRSVRVSVQCPRRPGLPTAPANTGRDLVPHLPEIGPAQPGIDTTCRPRATRPVVGYGPREVSPSAARARVRPAPSSEAGAAAQMQVQGCLRGRWRASASPWSSSTSRP